MNKRFFEFLFAALISALPVSARDVVFIGLTGESAPGMQVHFSRILQERLESTADIHVVNNPETERLRLQLSGLSYPSLTASLASSLRRCAGDSALVVWGMVKEFSVTTLRKQLIKKQLSGQLKIELAVYDPMTQSYTYLGEVTASTLVDKGYTTEFGDLNRTDQVPVMEREGLLDTLQSLAAVKSAAILVKSMQPAHAQATDTAKGRAGAPGTAVSPAAGAPRVKDSSQARSATTGNR